MLLKQIAKRFNSSVANPGFKSSSSLNLEKDLYEISRAKYLKSNPPIFASAGSKRNQNVNILFPSIDSINPKTDLPQLMSNLYHKKYTITRSSKLHKPPVYLEIRRQQIYETVIRRIEGDAVQLKKDLQQALSFINPDAFRVVLESNKVVISGNYVREVSDLLEQHV